MNKLFDNRKRTKIMVLKRKKRDDVDEEGSITMFLSVFLCKTLES
jgi:hypothetical protein